MYTKEEIWASFANEIRIIKHLAEKIPQGKEHHKPTERQRTTLELLQYLSVFGVAMLDTVLSENADAFGTYIERSKETTVENFSEMMDREEKEMKDFFDRFDDAALATELALWGMKHKKSIYILNLLKMLTAYKMQLFLYVKQSGVETIGTSNLWAGMDMSTHK